MTTELSDISSLQVENDSSVISNQIANLRNFRKDIQTRSSTTDEGAALYAVSQQLQTLEESYSSLRNYIRGPNKGQPYLMKKKVQLDLDMKEVLRFQAQSANFEPGRVLQLVDTFRTEREQAVDLYKQRLERINERCKDGGLTGYKLNESRRFHENPPADRWLPFNYETDFNGQIMPIDYIMHTEEVLREYATHRSVFPNRDNSRVRAGIEASLLLLEEIPYTEKKE